MTDDMDFPVSATYRRWLGYEPESVDETQEVLLIPRKDTVNLARNLWVEKEQVNQALYNPIVGTIAEYPTWVLKAHALDALIERLQWNAIPGDVFTDFEYLKWYQKPTMNKALFFFLDYRAKFKRQTLEVIIPQMWRR